MEKFTRSQLFSWFIQDRLIRQEDDIFDQKVNSALGREIERDGIMHFFFFETKGFSTLKQKL